MRNFSYLIALLFIVTGCSSNKIGRQIIANRAKTEMVGMSKAELLACAGPPTNSAIDETSGLESLSYGGGSYTQTSVRTVNSTMNPVIVSNQPRDCSVLILLEQNKITSVNYRGNGSLAAPDELCASVVENCIE